MAHSQKFRFTVSQYLGVQTQVLQNDFSTVKKEDDRLPPAYFPLSNFVKDAFQKNFLSKTAPSAYILSSPNLKNFFFGKNFTNKVEKAFLRNNIIISFYSHSTANLPP